MSQGDPTDNALAAIASILDQPEVRREPVRPAVDERPPAPPSLPTPVEELAPAQARPHFEPEEPLEIPVPIEADGYSRVGPGPMAAIRFKWSVRADNGSYYVDETIGENSNPIINGPMSRDAAVQMVHAREAEAHRRFEELKSEMSGRGAAANPNRKSSGDI